MTRKPFSRPLTIALTVGAVAAALVGCQSMATTAGLPPLALAAAVELPRFMGQWYVIASIPTSLERGAHNARETYRLQADGSVDTTFRFEADGFGGSERTFRSRGFIDPGNAAVWGQQYVWPIRADYRIAYVDADYGVTVIGRDQRDYVWIMARTPAIEPAEYARLVEFIGGQGYDVAKLQRVPQQAGR